MFKTLFRTKPFLMSLLLVGALGVSFIPLGFSAEYDLATLKMVLVKLHQRYEESVKTNAQLSQQVKQLKTQLSVSPQRNTSAFTAPVGKGMSLVPQGVLSLQMQLAQLQDENKVLKQRVQSASSAESSDTRLTQAHQELQKAVSTIQDQQRQIASLSERIEALQSMQVNAPITLNGQDASIATNPTTSMPNEGRTMGAAVNITPLSVKVVNMVNQASELRKSGKWEAAQAILLKASSLAPEEATVYYNLGNTYAGQNKLTEAVGAYTKAITLKSEFAPAYYNLGVVYQRLEDLVQAKKYLNLYLSLEPTCSNKADVEAMIQSL